MSWSIIERIDDRVAIWYDAAELRGLPYAVEGRGPAGWVEPTAGRYRTLREARAAARERIAEADGRLRDLQQAASVNPPPVGE